MTARASLVCGTAVLTALSWPAAAGDLVELTRAAYLMGTRVTLTARAADRDAASDSLETLLRSLEHSEALLSTWRSDTPLSRLNAAVPEKPTVLDAELCALFRDLSAWREQTGGTFDPAVGPLIDAWGIERDPRLPSGDEIARLVPAARLPAWNFDPAACTVTRPAGGRLDSGAFGKGAAIDAAARLPVAARGWLLDLGGQIGAGGEPPLDGWRVGIAHPLDRDREILALRMASGSLATSGGSERDRRAGGRRVGHILDPRSGRPAAFDGSVVVWHDNGLAADILSTALYVMGPEEGRRWAEAREIAAIYLVPRGGEVVERATSRWRQKPWRSRG